jgi:hypothetical protein
VEAAVERRVVQVMFTVPKSKLRVVNADVDGSSLISAPRDSFSEERTGESSGSPSRVKDLASRFEQISSSPRMSPRASPRPSPSPSIKSLKIRAQKSTASLGKRESEQSPLGKSRQEWFPTYNSDSLILDEYSSCMYFFSTMKLGKRTLAFSCLAEF